MATKKDLVEAYSFSRRRLVTAFVSGAPGGREVEPARPGRTIVGGLALAVLLVAGAAIAGVFAPRTPDDWTEHGLIVSKDTGQAYVIVPDSESSEIELRPVINITSAALILGPDVEPMLISQDTIDDQQIGEDIGILGAPASVPDAGLLVDDGWTACTAAGSGIRTRVAVEPSVLPASGQQVLVESDGEYWLIAQPAETSTGRSGAYAYQVVRQEGDRDETDPMLLDLGAGTLGTAVPVPREWLDLFPRGADLDYSSVEVEGLGDPLGYSDDAIPAGARVGDLLTADGRTVLLLEDGPALLDPFAATVYEHLATPAGFHEPLPASSFPGLDFEDPPLADSQWPTELLTSLDGPAEPCAQLLAEPGAAPLAQLAQAPGDDASAAGLGPETKAATVDPGRGAYVLSGGWTDSDAGAPYVIDGKGRANPLGGTGAAEQLGYAGHPVVVVPDSWIGLFEDGVELSEDAALCPPGSTSCE
ncbi:type VII secretion protein EccB [Nocardioides sp. SR21]|uniref:type VII secretion protein EccB n=1 Tax=Nocardioides sp. SR21 TaxID=2919501 RepID=UPI001FAA074D|nr:type VII secretion protein EccB [Nocardioides sp. SR21]